MESRLKQIIEVQAEQNQLLKKQLRWLKFGLLMMVAVLVCSLGAFICIRGKLTVVTSEPIIEHPISVGEDDASKVQFSARLLAENDPIQWQADNRLTVPPMEKTVFPISHIEISLPESEYQPGRGCDGMCL